MMLPYSKDAEKLLLDAEKLAKKFRHNYVGSEHLLMAMVAADYCTAGIILQTNELEYRKIYDYIKDYIDSNNTVTRQKDKYTQTAKTILENAQYEALRLDSADVGTEHILLALLKKQDCMAVSIMNDLWIDMKKVYLDVLAACGVNDDVAKRDYSDFMKSFYRDKSSTPYLDQFSTDLTRMARQGEIDPLIGRKDEIARTLQILNRRVKNNPCMVGEPGVGKTAIVEGIAYLIANDEVPDTLKGKRIVSLDLSGMVAGSKYRGEFEERIKRIIYEVINEGNIILFLDEIHTIIGAGGAEGALDAANILKPALSRGEIQLIGATTISEYRKYIEKDAALERRFQPVNVEEPTKAESIDILNGLKHCYEEFHDLTISDEAVKACVELSSRYITDRNLPDKAIDLMDEACSRRKLGLSENQRKNVKHIEIQQEIEQLGVLLEEAIIDGDMEQASQLKKRKDELAKKLAKKAKTSNMAVVTENDIADVVSVWTKIPVNKLTEKESKKLEKLGDELHKRVVGQEEAVSAVARAIKRSRVGLKDPKRPMGSFLFLGPTGVGKTELSKALSEVLFGNEDSLIRVDMSEFMEKHSVSKLIGSPPGYIGYDEGGQLCDKVRTNPYSVILFDEIEKAHVDVFNVLLQILDDGHVTDSKGRKVSFKNTIIIMTSNTGAERIIDPKQLGFVTVKDEEKEHENMKNNVMDELKKNFKPEFLNRIDDIIVFRALTESNIKDIVSLLLAELSKRVFNQMDISLKFNDRVKQFIFQKGYDKKYGARPLKRAIQTYVEDELAEAVIRGEISRGDLVNVSVKKCEDKESEKITFSVKNSRNNK